MTAVVADMRAASLRALALVGRGLRNTPLARSAALNRIHGLLALHLHGSDIAEVGPFKIHLDRRDRVVAKRLLLYGAHDPHELRLLCSLVRPGDHVADVGANIGIFTLHLSRVVGPSGRVIAIEPDPDNLALLRRNLEENGCANVTVVPAALGSAEGHADLFQSDDNRGELSFADLAGTGRAIRVSVRPASDVFSELGVRPVVMKLDVEGAEPLVMSGMGQYRPAVILLEFVPSQLRAVGQDPAAFLKSLENLGYALELVDPETGAVSSAPAEALLSMTEASQRDHSIIARLLPQAGSQAY